MPVLESSMVQRKSHRVKKSVIRQEEIKEACLKRGHSEEAGADTSGTKKVRTEDPAAVPAVKCEVSDECVLCGATIARDGRGLASVRFHYAREHYLPEGGFEKYVVAGGQQCPYQPCTKRIIRKRSEVLLHVATQHQKLREVMEGDGRLGVSLVMDSLYPREEVQGVARVKREEEPVLAREKEQDDQKKEKVSVKEPVVLQVKKEKEIVSTQSVEMEDSENVDDPSSDPVESNEAIANFLAKLSTNQQKVDVQKKSFHQKNSPNPKKFPETKIPNKPIKSLQHKRVPLPVPAAAAVPVEEEARPAPRAAFPRITQLHTCLLCDRKEGRNLPSLELRYHYSVCLYNRGWFAGVVEPGEENTAEDGTAIDEYGKRWKYQCPFPECEKHRQGVKKPISFKEFVIHMGMAHHLVERMLEMHLEEVPGLATVLEEVVKERREKGEVVREMPGLLREEIHTCLLCDGKDQDGGKDGLNLSLKKEKRAVARYHYACCYYFTGVYLDLYSPGERNIDSEGQPKEVLGATVKYTCDYEQCGQGRAGTVKRQMGYKEFCIHMAAEHGGLREVMEQDEREEVRRLVEKMF